VAVVVVVAPLVIVVAVAVVVMAALRDTARGPQPCRRRPARLRRSPRRQRRRTSDLTNSKSRAVMGRKGKQVAPPPLPPKAAAPVPEPVVVEPVSSPAHRVCARLPGLPSAAGGVRCCDT
jgi:hypothetical protein